jgi:hypothetical protein
MLKRRSRDGVDSHSNNTTDEDIARETRDARARDTGSDLNPLGPIALKGHRNREFVLPAHIDRARRRATVRKRGCNLSAGRF